MSSSQLRTSTPTSIGQTSWDDAKAYYYNCESLSSLLRGQVPVLDFVQWNIESIEQGEVHTILPLVYSSTNQHCTHQGALFFLAGEYTGGVALASLIPDWPVVGVHPVTSSEKSMALWLVNGDIRYFRPSVGRMDIVAKIDSDRHEKVRKRFLQGKTVFERVNVRFRNGDTDVAEAIMTFYIRQSHMLRADSSHSEKVNVLYQHKLISSAELITGVRARESGGLFTDPFAARIAGEHGIALANRFCERSPQLGGMVAARTRHLDDEMMEFVRNGGRNIVILGAGYDMRPFRLNFPAGTRIYELDFPTVLIDRQERLDAFGVADPEGVTRIQLPIDLRAATAASVLEDHMDASSPVFVAWEGVSMYFPEAEIRPVLAGIAPLLGNPQSRLWADFVTEQAIVNPTIFPEVEAFMQGMRLLGEPFVFGSDSLETFMESNGFTCLKIVPSSAYSGDTVDPVYSIYGFCVASAAVVPAMLEQRPVLEPQTVPAPHLSTEFAKTS